MPGIKVLIKRFLSIIMKNHIVLAAFLFPVIILEAAYASRGVFPFGPKDVLIVDLYHQYAPFLSELQDKLRSGSSLFYSWSGGMGTDFYSTFAYYLATPMNILIVLFNKINLTEAIWVLTLIKIGFAGAFFSMYLMEAYGKRDLSVAAFSLMYSLSGYVLAYSWNIMWLEGIYLMPLVILGLINLIRKGRALLYIVSLGLLLFSNFYIAFFVVLFTILYYPILIIQFLPEKSARNIINKTLQTAALSVLSAGIAAVMILPVISALGLTSAAGSSFPKDVTQYFDLFDYIGRHFPAAEPVIREGMPNLYCGLAALLLAPVFFLSRRFSRTEKVANALLLFFMILSFNLNVLNFVWHGFHFPNQLPFRNSFVYIFLLVTLSFRALDAKFEFPDRFWLCLTGAAACLALIAQKLNEKTPVSYDIYIVLALLGVFAFVFTFRQKNPAKRIRFVHLFLFAVILEITVSTILVIGKVDDHEYFSTRSGYLAGSDVPELTAQIKKIKEKEIGFYRMEVMPPKTSNDPYLYNYNGISAFSSMMPEKTVTVMEDLGFNSNSINSYIYEGSTLPMDSLLGVKYLIRRSGGIDERLKKQIFSKGDLKVYENPYAVSIGYLAPEAMKKWSGKPYKPFTAQNSFIENLTGVKDVFSGINVETGYSSNVNLTKSYSDHFSYTRNKSDSESRISIKVKDTDDRYVYLYLETTAGKINSGYVMAGSRKINFNAKRSTIIDVGFCKAGEAVSVELSLKADSDMNGSFGIYADTMNVNKFKEAIGIVSGNSMKIEKFKDTSIQGTIDAAGAGMLLTTIPYSKGWSVRVDGAPAATYAVDDGFLAFDIAKGKHGIRMDYMTPLFPLGAVISAVSMVLILAGILCRWTYFKLS